MGLRHDGVLLREIVLGLQRALEALRDSRPVELVEAELEVPFVGALAGGVAPASLLDFRNVSLLTEDIDSSRGSDTWSIRILVARDAVSVLRVQRHEASTTT